MRRGGGTAPGLAVLLAFAACGRGADFELVSFDPPAAAGKLALNAPITLEFSDDVDPSSVSPASISIRIADGAAARGRFACSGRRIRFVPQGVTAPDLNDGGYGNGGWLTVELRAFPSRSGVRAADGRPLRVPARARFDVVPASAAGGLFLDPAAGVGPRLLAVAGRPAAARVEVAAGGGLVLGFSEPLAPASVGPHALRLLYDNPDRDPVDTVVMLLHNDEQGVVEVRPRGGFDAVGTRYLLLLGDPGVTDLVGNPYDSAARQELAVEVTAAAPGGERR